MLCFFGKIGIFFRGLFRDYGLIAFYHPLLEFGFLGLLSVLSFLIERFVGFDIQQKILFQSLDAEIFLIPRKNLSIFTDLIIEQIDPLNSLKLVLDQHLQYEQLALM